MAYRTAKNAHQSSSAAKRDARTNLKTDLVILNILWPFYSHLIFRIVEVKQKCVSGKMSYSHPKLDSKTKDFILLLSPLKTGGKQTAAGKS